MNGKIHLYGPFLLSIKCFGQFDLAENVVNVIPQRKAENNIYSDGHILTETVTCRHVTAMHGEVSCFSWSHPSGLDDPSACMPRRYSPRTINYRNSAYCSLVPARVHQDKLCFMHSAMQAYCVS